MMDKKLSGISFNLSPHSFAFSSMEPLLQQQCIKQQIEYKALKWDDIGKCECIFTEQHLHKALCRKKEIGPVHLFTPFVNERLFKKQDFWRRNLSHNVTNRQVYLSAGLGWMRTFRSCLVSSKSNIEVREEAETNKTRCVEHSVRGCWAKKN